MADKVEPHPKMAGMGNRIRMLREQQGLSQSEAAGRAEMSQGAWSAYERDAVDGVALAQIMRISEALGTTIQWLAYGEPIPEKTARRYRGKSE